MALNDFEFSTFSKTKVDKDVIGTQKYKKSWEFILLISVYIVIYNELRMTEVDDFNKMVNLLNDIGFPITLNYKGNIRNLSKLKVGLNTGIFDASIESEFGIKPSNFSERISIINEKMMEVLSEMYFNDKKIIISIDGVDDILRFKKNQLEILSSLVRSIDFLNESFVKK